MKLNNRDLLHALSLLDKLPMEVIDRLLHQGQLRLMDLSSGEIVHLEGDPCTHMELVVKGRLAVERIDYCGNLLAIALFTRDDLIGGNLVFSTNSFYPLTITSVADTTIVKIAKEDLFTLLHQYPDFLREFLKMISENSQILHAKITSQVNRTVRERISWYLQSEVERQGSDSIVLPYSKKRLAEILGMQRTSLSRELDRMRTDGLLNFSGRNIIMLDMEISTELNFQLSF
jgi:CRP/FNR family transcriptional regulator, dissimilatory nitrate respiration regulator